MESICTSGRSTLPKNMAITAMAVLSLCACNEKTGTEDGIPVSAFSAISTGFSTSDGHLTLQTGFKAGDRIGIFAVIGSEAVSSANNLCLSATGDSGELTWTLEGASDELPANAVWYAYYPYSEQLPGDINPSAGDASGFFADIAANWETESDQNELDGGFSGSNFMTASAVPDASGKVSFSLKPEMLLAVFDFPDKIWHFTNQDHDIPDYKIPAAVTYKDFTPYTSPGGDICLIVNPHKAGTLEGTFASGTAMEPWQVEYGAQTDGANCRIYAFGDGDIVTEHLLQVGDFFLADGSILGREADEAAVQSSDVIGIIFQLDPDRIGEAEKEALGGYAHALAISPRNCNRFLPSRWYMDYTTEECDCDESAIGFQSVQTGDHVASYRLAEGDISGLRNTMLIATDRKDALEAGSYPAFRNAINFSEIIKGPHDGVRTTGWFLPSYGQMLDMVRNFSGLTLDENEWFHRQPDFDDWYWNKPCDYTQILNNAAAKIAEDGKDDIVLGTTYNTFWTSTQANSEMACSMALANNYLDCYYDLKKNGYLVRPMIAF